MLWVTQPSSKLNDRDWQRFVEDKYVEDEFEDKAIVEYWLWTVAGGLGRQADPP